MQKLAAELATEAAVPNLVFDHAVILDNVLEDMLWAYKKTKEDKKEHGFFLCGKVENNTIFAERHGTACVGSNCSLEIHDCKEPPGKVVGTFHTHVTGDSSPSPGDLLNILEGYLFAGKYKAPLDCRAGNDGVRCELLVSTSNIDREPELWNNYHKIREKYESGWSKMLQTEKLALAAQERKLQQELLKDFLSYKFDFNDIRRSIREQK